MVNRKLLYGLGFLGALGIGSIGGFFQGRYHERKAFNEQTQAVINKAHDRLSAAIPDLHNTTKAIATHERAILECLPAMYGNSFAARAQEAQAKGHLEDFLVNAYFLRELPPPQIRDAAFDETLKQYHKLSQYRRGLESLVGRFGGMITAANNLWDDQNAYAGALIESYKKTLPEGYR